MDIFPEMQRYGYEQVVLCHDRATGLRAIICIHDTTLGPGLGGCRMWTYPNEAAAVADAMRLARAMTYKTAAAGLDLGGAKAVIIGDPRTDKSEGLFRAFGRYVQSLQGRYITAEDVGTTVDDMDIIRLETEFVTGTSAAGSSGDPSPATAFGVWRGMKACAGAVWGEESLQKRTVAIQGVGSVGYHLAEHLADEGARLVVTDIRADKVERVVKEFGARAVDPDVVLDVDCDVFAPCALGGVLNENTIPRLKCKVVAGAANNQLATEDDARRLAERGILWAPDYVINAGGLINVADELLGYDRDRAFRKVGDIYHNVRRVIEIASAEGIPTSQAADRMAERRMELIGKLKHKYIPRGR